MDKFNSVDDYIASYPENVQKLLKQFRTIVKEEAPQAEERIGYGMPGYYLNGPLAYYGAFKHHVSLFATASKKVHEVFAEELKEFKCSKGTIQFPLNKNLPDQLIRKIIRLRVEENLS